MLIDSSELRSERIVRSRASILLLATLVVTILGGFLEQSQASAQADGPGAADVADRGDDDPVRVPVGGVLPTVFPSTDTVIGAYRHGTFVSSLRRTHLGVDVLESPLAGIAEPVHAMAEGTVTDVISTATDLNFGSLGYMALIRHRGLADNGGDLYSIYLHLASAPSVAIGNAVTKGQRIGTMGLTGAANSVTHTHFEIRAFSTRFSVYNNIYGPLNCDLRNAGVPPESTDGDDCDLADFQYFSSSWKDPQVYVVPRPPAPTNVRASDGTFTDRVRISWNSVNRSGVTYSIYRATCATCTRTLLASGRTGSAYDDRTAVAGPLYYYWLRASSSDGASIFSTQDSGYRAP